MKSNTLRIRVPATSANLGSGFDMTALALSLYNQFDIKRHNKLTFIGFDSEFMTPNNLVYQSYLKTLKKVKPNDEPLTLSITLSINDIPVSRGLGSSASCIIAGIFAANYFHELNLDSHHIFQIAVDIEGHPDNVGAAIFGGLISVLSVDKRYEILHHPTHKSLVFELYIPDFKGSTQELRDVLPTAFHRNDVVYQLERVAALFKGFNDGDIPLLKEATKDGMHQDKRLELLQLNEHVKQLTNAHCVTLLSGSGPTLLRIRKKDTVVSHISTELKSKQSLHISNGTTTEVLK